MVDKNSRKKGGDTKCLEKLQEQHNKLMESFRSILSSELLFLFPAMVGIPYLNKLDETHQAILLVSLLLTGYVGTVALTWSHSSNAMRWSAVVSYMTLLVTEFWLGIFHVRIALLVPEGYMEACVLVNIFMFMGGALIIGYLWHKFFQLPKSEAKED